MIKILKSGLHTSVQDGGRFGYRKFSVPVSGAMDLFSAQMANSILGNNLDASVLEMTMIGVKLKFTENTQIVISGADMSPELNNEQIQNNKIYSVLKDDVLEFGRLKSGLRCYLAIKGGFNSAVILGSQSFYEPITKQSKLLVRDTIAFNKSEHQTQLPNSFSKLKTIDFSSKLLIVSKGPEFDLLSDKQQEQLLNAEFQVSNLYNRMAYQLVPNFQNDLDSILTSAVLPGTVQLTPSGKLIVLMRDCQTTGGYPRVLQLTEAAINLLAQKKERDKISFKIKN